MNSSVPQIITAQTLRRLVTCERQVWLDAHGDQAEQDEETPETRWLCVQGRQHEQQVHEATTPFMEHIQVSSWEEGVAVTLKFMRANVPGIINAWLERHISLGADGRVFTIRGAVDRLERLPGSPKPLFYPVEIKAHAQASEADLLQLDLYVWLLRYIQDFLPPAELWLGAGNGSLGKCLVHQYDETRLKTALARAAELLTSEIEPSVQLGPDCRRCHWYSRCKAQAENAGSIDLLYDLSGDARNSMKAAGLVTLADVATKSPEELYQVKHIGKVKAQFLPANARAWLEQRPIWFNPLPEEVRQPAWMFDQETLQGEDRGRPWCMGWGDISGNSQVVVVNPAHPIEKITLVDGESVILVPDVATAWEIFGDTIKGDAQLVFAWGSDKPKLAHGVSPNTTAWLTSRFRNLFTTFKNTVSLPSKELTLKVVSRDLGFVWPECGDWIDALSDYHQWLKTGDLNSLTCACTYQRADVQSLAHVWRWIVANEPRSEHE